MQLYLDPDTGIWRDDDYFFDPQGGGWRPREEATRGEPVSAEAAARWLQKRSQTPCRVPVGVIGARSASPERLAAAEALGRRLAEIGFTVLCGGRQGVMTAVCKGVAAKGGISVGILPDAEPDTANPHVTIPIASGLGLARNAVIAHGSLCLVAVGGSYGTAAEVAFGLQLGKPVFGLMSPLWLPGLIPCASVEEAVSGVVRTVLDLPLGEGAETGET